MGFEFFQFSSMAIHSLGYMQSPSGFQFQFLDKGIVCLPLAFGEEEIT